MKLTNDTKRFAYLRSAIKVGVFCTLVCIIFPSLVALVVCLLGLIIGVNLITWLLKKFVSAEWREQWNRECVARAHRIREATTEAGFRAYANRQRPVVKKPEEKPDSVVMAAAALGEDFGF